MINSVSLLLTLIMNFLAHLFLSGSTGDVMLGNYLADAVKGKKYQEYPRNIANGILLHRAIDDFTDHHPEAEKTKKIFRKTAGKYSPVALDIVYDHYLAANFEDYSSKTLKNFSREVYTFLEEKKHTIPEHPRLFLTYMIENNILERYASLEGIEMVLVAFSRRMKYPSNLEKLTSVLKENYTEIECHFKCFFPAIEEEVKRKKQELGIQE